MPCYAGSSWYMSAVGLTRNRIKMALRLPHADIYYCSKGLPDIAFSTCSLLHAHHQQATMLYTQCAWAVGVREREEDNGGLPSMVAPCSAVT